MTTTVTARQGDTLDLLCWRHLGTTAGGVVEAAFELNRGLAEEGDVIAEGRAVILPDPPASAVTTLETVNLWD
ncbi:tail protein X [Novosphingobium huizhouense]|uniref:tail protein X n=1 Tax=Novosphingobium huizhouense TaxID=2866625 RepID=UPI001CD86A35|nr:tail protein X [Novosphingobium huizhouense]